MGALTLGDFVGELQSLGDRELIMDELIDLAARFLEVPPHIATRPFPKSHQVPGCESQAYVWASRSPDNSLTFHFAIENPQGISAKALAVILDETLSGRSLEEVLNCSEEVVYDIFGRNIASVRAAGLTSMIAKTKELARAAYGDEVK